MKYDYTDQEADGLNCIEILEGQYEGVVFHFTLVSFDETHEMFRFNFMIDHGPDELNESSEFKEYIMHILYDIIVGKENEN